MLDRMERKAWQMSKRAGSEPGAAGGGEPRQQIVQLGEQHQEAARGAESILSNYPVNGESKGQRCDWQLSEPGCALCWPCCERKMVKTKGNEW